RKIDKWNWLKDDVNQDNNFDNFTANFTAGTHTIKVSATNNSNGTSNTVTWTVTVQASAGTPPGVGGNGGGGGGFVTPNQTSKIEQAEEQLIPAAGSAMIVTPVSTYITQEETVTVTPQEKTYTLSEWLASLTGLFLPTTKDIAGSFWIYALILLVIIAVAVHFYVRRKSLSNVKGKYLFSWDDITGNDGASVLRILEQELNIDFGDAAKIEKFDDGSTVKISYGENYLSLKLNDEKTEVNLEIDDDRTYKFVVLMENSKLNLYESSIDDSLELSNYQDLEEFSEIKDEPVVRFIRIAELTGGEMLPQLMKQIYDGNIIIIDIPPQLSNTDLLDQAIKDLKQVVNDVHGDIAMIKSQIVITPGNVRIERKKIK
ncbi:MAG: cell division protein SepF, partial [Candidatus Methanoperedens sp.]|nr:cell division protein SepF [Candidatus Methanoperedens sp.]